MSKTKHFVNGFTFQMIMTAAFCQNFDQRIYYKKTKNVTWEEYIILDTLVCYPHLDILLISQKLFFELKYTQKLLNSLEKKKFIKTAKFEKNKIKTHNFELTQAGEKFYKENCAQRDEIIHMLLKFMTQEELTKFMKTLVKIVKIFISNTSREEDIVL